MCVCAQGRGHIRAWEGHGRVQFRRPWGKASEAWVLVMSSASGRYEQSPLGLAAGRPQHQQRRVSVLG